MSNRVVIQPTKFINLPGAYDITWGVRIYDDYATTYDNTWAEEELNDDLDILRKVCESDNEITISILDYCVENEVGLSIGNKWFDWEDIKEIVVE